MDKDLQSVVRDILKDIRTDLGDEFSLNFRRQAFFSEAWQRRRSPIRPGRAILKDTGTLSRSVRSRTDGDSIVFFSDAPYAAIHNEGGEIRVTRKMKRFFWAKCLEAQGSFGRRKDGSPRRDGRTVQLTTEAQFWKWMALMKEGSTVKIPRRRFLGTSPEVEQDVRRIIEDNLEKYFKQTDLTKKQ